MIIKRVIVVRKNNNCKWFAIGSAANAPDLARQLWSAQKDYDGWKIGLTNIPENETSYIESFRDKEREVYPAPIITIELGNAITNIANQGMTPCNPNIIGALTTLGLFDKYKGEE